MIKILKTAKKKCCQKNLFMYWNLKDHKSLRLHKIMKRFTSNYSCLVYAHYCFIFSKTWKLFKCNFTFFRAIHKCFFTFIGEQQQLFSIVLRERSLPSASTCPCLPGALQPDQRPVRVLGHDADGTAAAGEWPVLPCQPSTSQPGVHHSVRPGNGL